MSKLLQVLGVVWAPRATMDQASFQPVVVIPILIPTFFASIAAAMLYFRFAAFRPDLQAVWIVGLVATALGPLLISIGVSGFFFVLFSIIGRRRGYVSFLSITALAFLQTSIVHLWQSVILFLSDDTLSAQAGRLNFTYFLDPAVVSPGVYVAAGMVDVVSLWVLGLLVVGCQRLGSRSPRVNGSVVFVSWMVYAAVRIAFAGTLTL
jgi:hypothetical protein